MERDKRGNGLATILYATGFCALGLVCPCPAFFLFKLKKIGYFFVNFLFFGFLSRLCLGEDFWGEEEEEEERWERRKGTMYRERGFGGSKSEVGDRKRINDALDKQLERSSPSTSRAAAINGRDKTSQSALMGKAPPDHRDSRSAPLAKANCSDGKIKKKAPFYVPFCFGRCLTKAFNFFKYSSPFSLRVFKFL